MAKKKAASAKPATQARVPEPVRRGEPVSLWREPDEFLPSLWRPWEEFRSLRQEMERVFERVMRPWERWPALRRDWLPALDLSETADSVTVKVELPGVQPKDIDISISGDLLTVRGTQREEKEKKGESYHRVERHYGAFERTVRLPAEVEVEKARANFTDGVLRITLPKTERAKRPARSIPVEVGAK